MKNFLNLTLKELEENYDFSFKKFNKRHSLFLIKKNKNKLIFNYVVLNNLTIQKKQTIKKLFENCSSFTVTKEGKFNIPSDKLEDVLHSNCAVDLTKINKQERYYTNIFNINPQWFKQPMLQKQRWIDPGSLIYVAKHPHAGEVRKQRQEKIWNGSYYAISYPYSIDNKIYYDPEKGQMFNIFGQKLYPMYNQTVIEQLSEFWKKNNPKIFELYINTNNCLAFYNLNDFIWVYSNFKITSKDLIKFFDLKVQKRKENNFFKKYNISPNKIKWAIKYYNILKNQEIFINLINYNFNQLKIIGNFLDYFISNSLYNFQEIYNISSWRLKQNIKTLNLDRRHLRLLTDVVNQIVFLHFEEYKNLDWLFNNNQFDYIEKTLSKRYNQNIPQNKATTPSEKVERFDQLLSAIYYSRNQEIKKEEITTKNKKYFAMKEKMTKYTFAADNLVAILPQDLLSLDDETRQLHHCVWSYKDSIISGHSIILFIRHKDDINKSYYTMEIDPVCNKIRQVHGLLNSNPDEFVEKFLVEYAKNRTFIDNLSVKESYGRLAAH